jgi:hypothetical protein
MTLIFYLSAIYFILCEYGNIQIAKHIVDYNFLLDYYKKRFNKTLPFIKWDKEIKGVAVRGILFMIYSFVGLMSSQMPIFLVIILIGTFKKKTVRSFIFWRVIRIVLLMFIIINKYQLHVDLIKHITDLL